MKSSQGYLKHDKLQHPLRLLLAAFILLPILLPAQKYELPSLRWKRGDLIYTPDSLGNTIPDYSWCGYQNSNKAIPDVAVKVIVPVTENDASQNIQKAIDYVSALPLDKYGFRGAILLEKGTYEVKQRFIIKASGVVLRGSGNKTILKATGTDRSTLFRINGEYDLQFSNTQEIASKYVAVGSTRLEVGDGSLFAPGMQVTISRPCTQEWIEQLNMKDFGGDSGWLGWKPGERVISWERTLVAVNGNTLKFDAPLTTAIDAAFGGGTVSITSWPGRISNVGIENLTLESDYDASNPKDEDHCWYAITMENIQDAWVRQVSFRHFAGSAVALFETASQITVEDCISTEPVSEIAAWRRNTFFTMGQQTLFLRCYAENGYHDFASGFMAAGPNAFVQCEAVEPHSFSGAIDSWSSGNLFDIVNIDGQTLSFTNRGQDAQGAGWTAANSMFWQCSAARIECFAPPGAINWAYGAWSQFAGNGIWYEANSHIQPRSLFFAQLAKRLNTKLSDYTNQWLPYEGESTSSPEIEEAAGFIAAAAETPLQLKDYISQAIRRDRILTKSEGALSVSDVPKTESVDEPAVEPIGIENGFLVRKHQLVFGRRMNVPWWRGDARPYEAPNAQLAITRFVPGRVGNGYTDDLQEVVRFMADNGIVAMNHNYGLWYERRRDDHERVKRLDAEVWAPFYEQPFARSGQGEAWDRLSKYDLTKPNPWYWNRLREFAQLAEQQGEVLIHQNYFQHNILEAGAHWADSPWRPANNINNTGFPEPPPYSGDKRIYLAEQFYDITHPERHELHRQFIRQCMENFRGQSNVIQCISAEFTGPLHFVEFWLDVIGEWENETGEHPLIALSTTKDVQDAILADPVRSKIIDIIDIRYWAFTADGSVYEPAGGVNLAPRQHERVLKIGKRSFNSVYRSVLEYRTNYPDKAVIYSEGRYPGFGWAVFMAGGSLPVLPLNAEKDFLEAALQMKPFETGDERIQGLHNTQNEQILYCRRLKEVELDLTDLNGNVNVKLVHPGTGLVLQEDTLAGGEKTLIQLPTKTEWLVWIAKNE